MRATDLEPAMTLIECRFEVTIVIYNIYGMAELFVSKLDVPRDKICTANPSEGFPPHLAADGLLGIQSHMSDFGQKRNKSKMERLGFEPRHLSI